MNAIIQGWQRLAPREQRIVSAGSVLLVVIIAYFGMWEPFTANHAQLRNIVAAQQETVQWMHSAAQEVQHLQTAAGQSTTATRAGQRSLLSIIDHSMRQKQLSRLSQRIEPKGSDTVQVNFDQVSFNTLLQWLADLYTQYQVTVTQITLEPQPIPGTVKVRVSLFRG